MQQFQMIKKILYLTDDEIQGEIKKIEDALNGVGRVLIKTFWNRTIS